MYVCMYVCMYVDCLQVNLQPQCLVLGGGTPYIGVIGIIVVFFRGCGLRFSIFRGSSGKIYLKIKTGIC